MKDLPRTPLTPVSLQDLPPGSVVICATLRLSQMLSRIHDEAADQSSSWQSLKSTTLQQWLLDLYDDMALRGEEPADLSGLRVLDPFQERLIWEQVIHESLDRNAAMLFDINALAATAAEAHALIYNWHISIAGQGSTLFSTEEQTQFRIWRVRFLERCNRQKLIDRTRLNAILIEHLDSSRTLPEHVVFAGFDHYSPLQNDLHIKLQDAGRRLFRLTLGTATQTTPQVHRAIDVADECLRVANWVHTCLQSNPEYRVGIVAPNLASYRFPLIDALEDVLDPSLVLARHAEQARPFNISLGQPLASQPLVRTALNLLQILSQSHAIPQDLISELLHSAYWSKKTEADARARLDVALRENVAPKASLTRYRNYAHNLFEKQSLQAPTTLHYLRALAATAQGISSAQRMPSDWRQIIQTTLGKTGWLATGSLSSSEFQVREAFAKELGELAKLDGITDKVTFSKAISLLAQLCNQKLFQPLTLGKPRIQILGMLEASGIEFDALWIMGLTDIAWPLAAKPNPLLPIESQRKASSPNACAAVQLDFAQRIQDRLLSSAPEIHISYPLMEKATELKPSPLIPKIEYDDLVTVAPEPWVVDAMTSAGSALHAIDDIQAPPLQSGEQISGGTWLLRAQAICPAWGFYEYRLGARALVDPVEGLTPSKRGTLVHDTLEIFWKKTLTLMTLRGMSDSERHTAVQNAAVSALKKFNAEQEALKPRQYSLELVRLTRLIDEWLQFEATREVDFVVLEVEANRSVTIEGIVARMRIDRVDQLADGRILIIDYKTGSTIDTRNWASDRITEPQLPIYAAIAEHSNGAVAGVAFGLIHIAGSEFKGIGEDDGLLPKISSISGKQGRRIFDEIRFPDWNSVLRHWHEALHNVAREIKEGDAAVRLTTDKDARYCPVLPILRLAERQDQLNAANNAARSS